MSARRILGRNAEALSRRKQAKTIRQMRIRTFTNEDSLQILRQKSEFTHLFTDKETLDRLALIRKVAAFNNLVYLTDIQCQKFSSFFVMHRAPISNTWLHSDYGKHTEFDLFINPSITGREGEPITTTEQCHSFPFIDAKVQRHAAIELTYTQIKNLPEFESGASQVSGETSERLEGFRAVVAQHCMDHLNGRTFLSAQLTKGRLSIQYDDQHFKDSRFLLREYNARVKRGLEQHTTESEEFRSMEKQYQGRLRTAFKKEAMDASEHEHNMRKFR